MRYLLVMFLVMCFVVGCGCSNVLTPPVLAQDTKDVWPIFYGTDNGGPDNGLIVFWDQDVDAWQAPRTVDTDLLDGQWTSQRNAVGWRGGAPAIPGGKWNVSFIEATGNDLELWASPDDGWQDDAGAWAMLDGDASFNWEAVDVETRQNYVWACIYLSNVIFPYAIDLGAGAPVWTSISTTFSTSLDNTNFSIALDDHNQGFITLVGVVSSAIDYAYVHPSPPAVNITYNATGLTGNYPQASESFATNVFYTNSNVLNYIPHTLYWPNIVYEAVYTATALTSDYHATWLKMDDTIHVILVDTIVNATELIYLRRTPNGWTAPVTLLLGDVDEVFTWPQICVDKIGDIFVSYIYDNGADPVDLRGFYLDATLYSDYDNVGNWAAHLDIDQAEEVVIWAIMPDSVPISMEM